MYIWLQANDGVLLKGKLGEYADAFTAVDKDGNGEAPSIWQQYFLLAAPAEPEPMNVNH